MQADPRFIDVLVALAREGAEFIVVGGIAAIIQGAPVMTADLDVVYDPDPANVGRLLAALLNLNPRYNDPAGRHIVPDESKLTSIRVNRLLTDLGPLDVLQQIGPDLTFADLVERTEEVEIAGFPVRVLSLEAIIETKEHANRPKDHRILPYLREILELKAKP